MGDPVVGLVSLTPEHGYRRIFMIKDLAARPA